MSNSISPITSGVRFVKGRRYMINTDTKVIFPYNASMAEQSSNLREFTPDWPEDEAEASGGEVGAGKVDEEIVIAKVAVSATGAAIESPLEKARRIKAEKKAAEAKG